MRRFNSIVELKECFTGLINSHSSDLGLAPNEILIGSHKAKAPYVEIDYYTTGDMVTAGHILHKVGIIVIIVIEYAKDVDLHSAAVNKAGVIERICLENNFTYDGHATKPLLDMDGNVVPKSDYFLMVECSAYHRNV